MSIQERLLKIIRDDNYAAGFQNLGQYRTALLQAARGEVEPAAVQEEPVGWQFYQHGEWWNGDHRIKDHRKNTEEAGFRVRDVYAGPQPAEQQPVRLPQRAKPQKDDSASIHGFCDGWNNCLDEVARLNGDRMANPEPDVEGLLEALEEARRELNSCQSVIHYAGGFDPAYVTGAQAALVKIDAALAAQRSQGGEVSLCPSGS